MSPESITSAFTTRFGPGPVHLVRSPGRVNLIGEHTDYNDGYVFPMAIEPQMLFAFRPRTDGIVRVASTQFPDDSQFDINKPITPLEPRSDRWENYVRGVAAELLIAKQKISGMDALIDNTLPPGSGLSSSAAIEVGTGNSLLASAGTTLDPVKLALVCQKAEHNFPGVPCGIMDQMIVACGKADHAMLLDCRTLEQKHVPLDGTKVRIVIVNSMVKHALTGGEYAERRGQCEAGVAALQKTLPTITHLRDVTPKQLEDAKGTLKELTYRRCRHVVTEIDRTPKFAELLAAGKFEEAGKLMVDSHNSLSSDYEVSTDELDLLVKLAMQVPGVYGSRMTGAGFGGCTVSLVKHDAVDAFTAYIIEHFGKAIGQTPQIFVTRATAGSEVLS